VCIMPPPPVVFVRLVYGRSRARVLPHVGVAPRGMTYCCGMGMIAGPTRSPLDTRAREGPRLALRTPSQA
jgi:hypothetical protein